MVGSWQWVLALGQGNLGQYSTVSTINAPSHFMYPMNKSSWSTWTSWLSSLFGDLLAYPKTEEEPFSWLGNIWRPPCQGGRTIPTTIVKKWTSSLKSVRICKPLLSKELSISMSKGSSHQDLAAPFKITTRRREDGNQLELPPELPTVHNIFHTTQHRKCFQLPN